VRSFLPIIAISFAAAGIASAAGKDDPVVKIRAVMSAQVAAWNRGDIDGFMEGYARSEATRICFGATKSRGAGERFAIVT